MTGRPESRRIVRMGTRTRTDRNRDKMRYCSSTPVRWSIRAATLDIARSIRRSTLTLALACLLATQATTGAQATPGDLDQSFSGFGDGGQYLTNLPINVM